MALAEGRTAWGLRLMSHPRDWTQDEMMTVAAARLLWDGCVCFVGIGLPSAAANLARHTHAPHIVLIYESGTIGARPQVLPLSIGDPELATTASAVVPLPEIFAYWLQGGRIDVGALLGRRSGEETSATAGRIVPLAKLKKLEEASIRAALERTRGKVYGPGGAAEQLGVKPSTLASRMKSLGIEKA